MNKLLNLDIPYSLFFELLFRNKEHVEMARMEFEEELKEKIDKGELKD